MIARLRRNDVITLSLPGFGGEAPTGFDATKDGYVDWLLAELARQPGPIDVVGHDWGALLVTRAVSLRPQAFRSWAGGGAPLDPDYEWHQAATMKRCILALYRSAVHVRREWSDDLRRITAPGLVLWGELDPYAASRFGARLAERTNARFVCLRGCSHWWQLEPPDVVADELQRFWKEVSSLRARAG